MNNLFTLGDLSAEPTERKIVAPKPFCTSQTCCRYQTDAGKWAFHPYVELSVKRGAFDCPRCHHALWWTRDPEQAAS